MSLRNISYIHITIGAYTEGMIDALIFDFDGLILDTESPDFHAWQEIYADHGVELALSVWAQNIGGTWLSQLDPYDHLEALTGEPVDRLAIRQRYKSRVHELLAVQPVLPGIREYLAAAKRLGIRTGVASSSTHEWVDGNLDRLGLLHEFEVIRCSDDVSHVKPHPELYLSALDALNVPPHRAIALEDSPNGAAAASAAGLFCVVVPNRLTGQLTFDHADLRLDKLSDLRLEQLVEIVENRKK